MIQNGTKRIWKNVINETAIYTANFIWYIYIYIYIFIYLYINNGRHPVTKTFTPLHYTSLHYTSLHFTTLHTTSLHFTTLHYTSLPSHLSYVQIVMGRAVAQLVMALRYKPEGHSFDSGWSYSYFSLTPFFRPSYGLGVDSACDRYEY
jgi:hypothetical protein